MRIGLLDVDSKIPNLALMRLSAWHKDAGDLVESYSPLFGHDKVYASKIFKFSSFNGLDPNRMVIGGTGWDMGKVLPPEVEATPPDYSMYGYPHNIGFTMRGCRFRCKFCVVPEKEGRPKSNSTIAEIWQQRGSDFVVLLDNDFFGNPEWADRIAEIRKHDLRVCFSQGLNIRVITEEQCAALASVKFQNLKGTRGQVHFAWDRYRDKRLIDRGIDRVLAAGIKPWRMAFFVLIGFDTTPEQDLERVLHLRDRGCDPFVMPFDRENAYQADFARWVNNRAVFKSVPWAEYRGSIPGRDPAQAFLL